MVVIPVSTIIILLAIILGLMILVPVGMLVSRWLTKKRNKPNPNEAAIFVHLGDFINSPVLGIRFSEGQEGDLYHYTFKKKLLVVTIPSDRANYPLEWLNNRRVIHVDDGNSVAMPGSNSKPGARNNISAQDLSNLTKGYVFHTLVDSLKTSALPGLMLIIIIAGVALALGFGAAKAFGGSSSSSPTTKPPVTSTATTTQGQSGTNLLPSNQGGK